MSSRTIAVGVGVCRRRRENVSSWVGTVRKVKDDHSVQTDSWK